MQIVGSHKFQAAYVQLHSQSRILDEQQVFSLEKHSFFIMDIRGQLSNLHVEPLDLFSCALHLEVLIHKGPRSLSDIFSGIGEEGKGGEEGIFNNTIPG